MNSFSNEGEELTYKSQQRKLESINISYPKSSKQLGFWGMTFMQATKDFRIMF
jgi:hypothetical protein